jgi:hypothetical protein
MANSDTKFMPKVFGWSGVLLGLGTGVWWYFHLPTAGKGGLVLAVGATLMPLVWEKVGVACKMSWIAMLFLLFAVEYRAIDEDKQLSAQELTIDFKKISDQANDNLKRILSDEHTSFTGLLQTQQDNFAALLAKQRGLFDRQQEMIESLNGHLLPGDEPPPSAASLGCQPYVLISNNTDLITIGPYTSFPTEFPFVPLGLSDFSKLGKPAKVGTYREVISVSKDADGLFVLLLDVRNVDGSIIVRFDEDGFEVGPGFFKRHPNKSTLIVTDLRGTEVLKVVYANKHYLWMRAKIIVNGELIEDTSALPHLCMFPGAGTIEL